MIKKIFKNIQRFVDYALYASLMLVGGLVATTSPIMLAVLLAMMGVNFVLHLIEIMTQLKESEWSKALLGLLPLAVPILFLIAHPWIPTSVHVASLFYIVGCSMAGLSLIMLLGLWLKLRIETYKQSKLQDKKKPDTPLTFPTQGNLRSGELARQLKLVLHQILLAVSAWSLTVLLTKIIPALQNPGVDLHVQYLFVVMIVLSLLAINVLIFRDRVEAHLPPHSKLLFGTSGRLKNYQYCDLQKGVDWQMGLSAMVSVAIGVCAVIFLPAAINPMVALLASVGFVLMALATQIKLGTFEVLTEDPKDKNDDALGTGGDQVVTPQRFLPASGILHSGTNRSADDVLEPCKQRDESAQQDYNHYGTI